MPSLKEIRDRLRVQSPPAWMLSQKYRYKVDSVESPPLKFKDTIYDIGWWCDEIGGKAAYGIRINSAVVSLSAEEISQTKSVWDLIAKAFWITATVNPDLSKAIDAMANGILLHRQIAIRLGKSDA